MVPAFYNDLTLTETEAWRWLAEGARDRTCAFHMMQLASLRHDASGTLEVTFANTETVLV